MEQRNALTYRNDGNGVLVAFVLTDRPFIFGFALFVVAIVRVKLSLCFVYEAVDIPSK